MKLPTLVTLRALKLGDLLVATPALRALGRAFPMHRRLLCAPAGLEPIVRLIGAVDDIVDTPDLEALHLETGVADVAVNLHGRGPESSRLLAASEPRRLIAFGSETVAGPHWRDHEHERSRWCRLLECAGIDAEPDDISLRRNALPRADSFAGVTVVHPGAASEARRWPADRFAAVARSERALGRRVVVTGTVAERGLASVVVEQAGLPRTANLAGRTSLTRLASIVAVAGRVCCGDTGIAHVATGFGTPSVVLFGPVSPSIWGPPEGDRRHRALWKGSTGDPHATRVDPGLLRISIDDVIAALQELPRADAPDRARTRRVS